LASNFEKVLTRVSKNAEFYADFKRVEKTAENVYLKTE
jgi:hypothetical protein